MEADPERLPEVRTTKTTILISSSVSALLAASCVSFGQNLDSGDVESRTWIQIHTPVDDAFKRAFETRTSESLEPWLRELRQFYRTDGRLVYRGVCDDVSRTIDDLVDAFVSVGNDLVSEAVAHARGGVLAARNPIDWTQTNFDLKRSIFGDLSRFNHDAYLYSLYTETSIHQLGAVPGNESAYENSYGFSTSWSYFAAAEFSGVYPGDPPCSNSLVYALYPANHYIDYANLAAVDYRFALAYPAEREVLGIGGVDPDAVMLLSRLSRNGAEPVMTEVLIRNPLKPSEVFYFDGGVDGLDDDIDLGWSQLMADRARRDAVFREYRVMPPTPPSIPPDTAVAIPVDRPLEITFKGAPRSPTRVISLDYRVPLFPALPAPVTR